MLGENKSYKLKRLRSSIPKRVTPIPIFCCLVTGSLKMNDERVRNSVGEAPAIGVITEAKPPEIPEFRAISPPLSNKADKKVASKTLEFLGTVIVSLLLNIFL